MPSRTFAIGDPQAPADKFFAILDAAGLRGKDGRLLPDVTLVSIGDHFDYGDDKSHVREIGDEGLAILRWLAAHSPEQVVILAGNHDLSRVQELALETDESFALARKDAEPIARLSRSWKKTKDPREGAEIERLSGEFAKAHPNVPTWEIASRDYSSWSEEQRALVQELLLEGRFRLGQAAVTKEGRPLLLTHASVGRRELDAIGLIDERDPLKLAGALDEWLGTCLESDAELNEVRRTWKGGERVALDLYPLHVHGRRGREGGGMLYRRPTNPARTDAKPLWDQESLAPRRFDPRELPLGLLQACGHTGPKKCLEELEGYFDESLRALPRGELRTLRSDGKRVFYEAGATSVPESEAGVIFIDSEMHRCEAGAYRLLELGGLLA